MLDLRAVINCAVFLIISAFSPYAFIFQLVELSHFDITTIPDGDVVARGNTTIVKVSDVDVSVDFDASAV